MNDLELPREGLTSFDVEPLPAEPEPEPPAGPIPLDAFAVGIDPLDGLVVFSLSDGSVHGAWIRADAGFSADDVALAMREAYRTSLQAARKLAIFAAAAGERGQIAEPIVTIESPVQTALLKRIRAYVVATLFDASMPLGMARLCAGRLCAALEPELPLTELERLTLPPTAMQVTSSSAPTQASRPPLGMRLSMPLKPSHASAAEVEHARKIIAHAEAHLPDAHTVRLRLALRAHTSRLSLDHPETLASDTILRIETAVLEMLGIDRDQLARALTASKGPEGR